MGNKNTSSPKGPDSRFGEKEDDVFIDDNTGIASRDGAEGLSPELLASLQTLGENTDYTLLPHSLHQIAEAYSLQGDYHGAVQFLQLEKLYHERLLANLASLQERWESHLKEKNAESAACVETECESVKYIETLRHICRTHSRPSVTTDKNMIDVMLKDMAMKSQTLEVLPTHEDDKPDTSLDSRAQQQNAKDGLVSSSTELDDRKTDQDEDEEDEKEMYEEGQEVEEEEPCAGTPEEEEETKVEWPAGVPQASDKDLAKLSNTEESSSPDGLVSILKRRRASLDGLPPPSGSDVKPNCKRKVRFSEPEDAIDQDEVSGDSCLILLLLCLVTVVISIGGTALYCTLVDTYSNICTDFTQNVNFYAVNLRAFFEGLSHWLPVHT